ncbi:hypothetical protein [Paenibacillus sp. YN15]|uniref:hypothetical protein n=1 Tax=Paenibacillus sp. YN15 TaxID=1742774 RepID=UPI000DCC591F|nr:hypothetical protein [Paenibacillus sp. YN15]RAU98636.1 hypothetical protein DQG13_17235 [Paenibacillus sp. YN15]
MAQAPGNPLAEYDQKWTGHFKQALQKMHSRYNPDNRLLQCPFSSPGYHTTIKQADFVHPFLQAMNYALALLDDQDPAYQQRAYDVLQAVIDKQDQNPESATYGIWSWFWEEPLEQMSPPDWNWADFIGKRLMLVLARHKTRLPAELKRKVEDALSHSCEAIIRRNVGPEYTNIAIMGTFVTLVGGEVLGNSRFKEYGVNRLQRVHGYTMKTGTFLEYNSPAYGSVCLIELSGLVSHMQDKEARKLAEELLELTWTMTAEHFHPSTMEWSGPHARSYDTFLSSNRLSFLHMALQGRLPLIPEEEFTYNTEWYGNEIHCPEHLLPFFGTGDTRELQAQLPATDEFGTRTAYTYMTPSWSMGSFNHGIMWNQTRNLLAFLGHSPRDSFYARLRVLHDGYDYCSAIYAGQQRRGEALFGICFALDGGDTHPNLNLCHGKITAADLRVRLEIGAKGQAPLIAIAEDGAARAEFPGTGLALRLELAAAKWGGGAVRLEAVEEQGIWAIDAVLYSGEAELIDFHAMEEAAFLFHLSLGEADQLAGGPDVQWQQKEGDISGVLGAGADALHVRIPVKPADKQDIFRKQAL